MPKQSDDETFRQERFEKVADAMEKMARAIGQERDFEIMAAKDEIRWALEEMCDAEKASCNCLQKPK